ncbi:hypothetical protein FF1_009975 [Malus domestica]
MICIIKIINPYCLKSFSKPTSASESLNVPTLAPELFNTMPIPTTSSSASKFLSTSPESTIATQSHIHVDPDFQPESLIVILPIPTVSLHPMQTRSKTRIVKRKALSTIINTSESSIVEPTTYRAASKVPEWQAIMQDEISALHTQQTWDLVPFPNCKT